VNIATAQQRMNEFGRSGRPFLFLFDFELTRPLVFPLDDVDPAFLRYDLNGVSNAPAAPDVPVGAFRFNRFPEPFEHFEAAFARARAALQRGDTFLLNLTTRTRIETDLTLPELFARSRARYRLLSTAGYPSAPETGTSFVCFSPEIFVQVDADGIISTNPMKGTRDARLPDARAALLADAKEQYEHATIVDLLRNDLAAVTTRRWVQRYRYVEELRTHAAPLLQVSSEIRGTLPPDWRACLGDWILKLLPAGSISGAPKPRTVELIREIEGRPRGYYTGIVGLFDGRTLDSGVLIRFIEQTAEGLFFRSGGGITFRSDARSEYQEVIDKVYLPIW
jgi:para-aminobenzoate synthetase component 1